MRKFLVLIALVVASAAPQAANSATGGMSALDYYVGTWNCVGTQTGQPSTNATVTYTMDSGVMRTMIVVPAQGKMKKAYVQSGTTTYDSKNERYVGVSLDNENMWGVSYAKPWTGDTEAWTDHASSSGKLGHSTTVRSSADAFVYTGYPSMTGKADFKATCHKAS